MGEDETVCNINKYINNSNYIPTVYNTLACQMITQASNNTHNIFMITW
jgi:acyl-ACP thioesterase